MLIISDGVMRSLNYYVYNWYLSFIRWQFVVSDNGVYSSEKLVQR